MRLTGWSSRVLFLERIDPIPMDTLPSFCTATSGKLPVIGGLWLCICMQSANGRAAIAALPRHRLAVDRAATDATFNAGTLPQMIRLKPHRTGHGTP
jgi:hypothetical protein